MVTRACPRGEFPGPAGIRIEVFQPLARVAEVCEERGFWLGLDQWGPGSLLPLKFPSCLTVPKCEERACRFKLPSQYRENPRVS